jgi:predicted ATPase/DNA-binding CsgD family transcriptional regulator/GAF domain-containing protein
VKYGVTEGSEFLRDNSPNLHNSDVLYGREEHLATIQEAFQWASLGSTELVLLSGPPGIGKSTFVQDAFKPTVVGKCYYARGKFELYNKGKPYEPLIRCFQFVIRQLLTEPDTVLHQWGEKLREAVGANGSIITEVIPEARLLLGELPPSEQLPSTESHHRFEWVFRRFVRVFTRRHHPLVLFFDDVQWADRATLELLHSLLVDPEIQHLLIVGAYRDQDWNENARLFHKWLQEEHEGYSVRQLQLEPLDIVHVNEFVACTLGSDPEYCFPLAHTLFVKSIGNPLYLKQLLQSAYDEGMIRYDESTARWEWELERLHEFPNIDGQIEYLIERINKLPNISKQLLINAACLGGGRFSIRLLNAICVRSEPELEHDLQYAVQAGLLAVAEHSEDSTQYYFTHDRIHQAAYSLLNSEDRKAIHLVAGKFLLEHFDAETKEQALFEIVNHWNEALELLSADEREMVVRMNEQAGRKAMLSSAYETALIYFNHAIECLPDEYWRTHNEFAFQLHLQGAECEYLSGHYEQAESQLDAVLRRVHSWEQRAQVVKLKIDQYGNMGKYGQAIELGLTTLREVGVRISERPNKLAVIREMMFTKWVLDKRIAELSTFREIDDPKAKLMMELMISLVGPTFFSNREVFAVMVSKFIRLVYRYGATSVAPVIYASYGMLLSTALGDLSRGYQLGEIAVDMADRSGIASVKSKVYVMFYSIISPWMRFNRKDEDKLLDAVKLGMEAGDYVYASYAIGGLINLSYARHSMEEMHKVMRQSMQVIEHTQEDLVHKNMIIYMNFATKLQSTELDNFAITDGMDNEAEFLDEVNKEESGAVTLYQVYTYKTQIYYLFGRYKEAIHYAELANPYEALSVHAPHLPIHHLYEALAIAAELRENPKAEGAREWRRTLKKRYKQFQSWATMSPENFEHKHLLIRAEQLRNQGPEHELITLYDRSIASARKCGEAQYVALACECAARFHGDRGRERIAHSYMQEAYDAYGEWGVESKRSSLRVEYPAWLQEEDDVKEDQSDIVQHSFIQLHQSLKEPDLVEIVKASLTWSQDVNLPHILQRLQLLIVQTSGALKACLIAHRDQGLWVEQVIDHHDDGNPSASKPSQHVEESDDVPQSLIQYCSRLGKQVHLGSVDQEELFKYDSYFLGSPSRSVSCLPLYAQEQLTGVLYLELPPDAYPIPSERIDTLCMLATQALFIARLADSFGDPNSSDNLDTSVPVSSVKQDKAILTERELQVLNLMSVGLSNKEIAIQLGVTAGTIKVHMHNVFSKLEVNKRTKAIAEAAKMNLLEKH